MGIDEQKYNNIVKIVLQKKKKKTHTHINIIFLLQQSNEISFFFYKRNNCI